MNSDVKLLNNFQSLKEVDQVNRYLKKIEKDDNYVTSALGLASMMEEKVKQNIAVEIYTDYFLNEDEATNWDEVRIKQLITYK